MGKESAEICEREFGGEMVASNLTCHTHSIKHPLPVVRFFLQNFLGFNPDLKENFGYFDS